MEKEDGGFITRTLGCIIIIGLLIYSGLNFVRPWYNYFYFKDRLKEISLSENIESKEKIMKRIMEAAKERNVSIEERDVKIESKGKGTVIKAEWDHEVRLYEEKVKIVFHFSVDTGKE
ncbi:MAG: hypothetical protein HZA09_01480 [Nitrospirae bacterium]|nr:hypothetical protein [Nitrospirota bacterium]